MVKWTVTGPEGGAYSFSSREAARAFAREKGGRTTGYKLGEYGERIARGVASGMTRTQARGHAPTYRGPAGGYLLSAPLKPSQQVKLDLARKVQLEFERALTFKINAKGKEVAVTLADVAKKHGTTVDAVKRYIPNAGIKTMPVLAKGANETVDMPVPGINDRRLLSKYANQLRAFQGGDASAGKWLAKERKIKLSDGTVVTLENDLERLRAILESGGASFEFYSEVA